MGRTSPRPGQQALYKALSRTGGRALPERNGFSTFHMNVSADGRRIVFLASAAVKTTAFLSPDPRQPCYPPGCRVQGKIPVVGHDKSRSTPCCLRTEKFATR